jgi:hypothetical protein
MSMPYDASSGSADEAHRRWQLLQEQADAERDALLVSDAERDQVCRRLSAAFSEGRITSPELDERTSRALSARTYGDLERVMAGLEPPTTTSYGPLVPTASAPTRAFARVLFWVVGLFTAPFILGGGAMVLFGDEPSTSIFGLVMLLLFLPGLIALYRWGHPKT